MRFDGTLLNFELRGNFQVGPSPGHQFRNFALPSGEIGQPFPGAFLGAVLHAGVGFTDQ